MTVGSKYVRPWGDPLDITFLNAADQNDPSITVLDNGSFVVCWESVDATGDKLIKARVYDLTGGAIRREFVVNTTNIHTQSDPVVTALAGGSFVIAWEDDSKADTSNSEDIRAQIFSATGDKIGGEFLVNKARFQDQENPAIATLTDGRFVVVWEDSINSKTQAVDLRAQIFNADGSKIGGVFLVNSTTEDNQFEPAISALSGGRFVVTWTENSEAGHLGNDEVIVAQIFSSIGAKLGGEFVASTTSYQEPSKPSVITLSDGRFLITWTNEATLATEQIMGQLFSSGGARIGGEFYVNTALAGNQDHSRATALHDGGFIVTWDSSTSSTNSTQWAQLFSATGTKVGTQFLVEDTPRDSEEATIATFADGRIVFTWEDGSLGNREDLLARIFDPRTSPVNLTGTDKSDGYVGTKFSDIMNGGGGNDILRGAAGDDTLKGNNGADELIGETGQDTLIGGAGQDSLRGHGGKDELNGGLDTDFLWGGANADTLLGGGGRDYLRGGLDNDGLFGGSGNDFLSGDRGDDTLVGGRGNDDLFGYRGEDKLWGNAGWDTLRGGYGNDKLHGGDNNDQLHGEEGKDSLYGGDGNDTLFGEEGKDTLWGGKGDDKLHGGDNYDQLHGDEGKDSLYGGDGNDTLFGEEGKDTLWGGKGDDTLWGGKGDDILSGGPERDVMYGGVGADQFVFFTATNSPNTNKADLIKDFKHGVDKIDLFAVSGPRLTFVGSKKFSGTDEEVRVTDVGTGSVVRADINVDGSGDLKIYLPGATGLTIDDFVL